MQVTNITIGADPELFIINTKTNKIVSAIGIIPGEKGKPYTKNMEPGGFGVEIDGILEKEKQNYVDVKMKAYKAEMQQRLDVATVKLL